jgi:hypothetical protein
LLHVTVLSLQFYCERGPLLRTNTPHGVDNAGQPGALITRIAHMMH